MTKLILIFFNLLIVIVILGILTSCGSENRGLTSFNKRKYTKGLFFDPLASLQNAKKSNCAKIFPEKKISEETYPPSVSVCVFTHIQDSNIIGVQEKSLLFSTYKGTANKNNLINTANSFNDFTGKVAITNSPYQLFGRTENSTLLYLKKFNKKTNAENIGTEVSEFSILGLIGFLFSLASIVLYFGAGGFLYFSSGFRFEPYYAIMLIAAAIAVILCIVSLCLKNKKHTLAIIGLILGLLFGLLGLV